MLSPFHGWDWLRLSAGSHPQLNAVVAPRLDNNVKQGVGTGASQFHSEGFPSIEIATDDGERSPVNRFYTITYNGSNPTSLAMPPPRKIWSM